MDLIGPKQIEWPKRAKVDIIDQIELNGPNRTIVDRIRPKRIEWTG